MPQVIQATVHRADVFIGAYYMANIAHTPGLGGQKLVEMVPVYYQVEGKGFNQLKSCESIYFVGAIDHNVIFSWTPNAYISDTHIVIRHDNRRPRPIKLKQIHRIVCVHHGGQSYSEITNGLPQTFKRHKL